MQEIMNSSSNKHVVVVGAGPGGLTCAMILAKRGFKVTVFEAEPRVGGRNAEIRLGDYSFDTGPTFLMLRAILDDVFEEAGCPVGTCLDVRQLNPMYQLKFAGETLDISSDPARMKAEIARVFPGKEARYDGFLRREGRRFARLYPCLQKPYHRAATLLHPDLIKALPHLALNQTLYTVMRKRFGAEQLALAFTFQSKYLGMSPWDCPGLFAMIPYIEHAFGIYHTMGGLHAISRAMADTVRRHGGTIHLNRPVRRILVDDARAARGVELADGERIAADEVVINADFGYAMNNLFEPGQLHKYPPRKLAAMKLSCSTFMIYAGVNRAYDMPFHTICFADNYKRNLDGIFSGVPLGDDISFYVRNASVLDPSLAPPGHSAIYILVPVSNMNGQMQWPAERQRFRDTVLKAVAQRTAMTDIRDRIVTERIITPLDWETDHRVYRGATFNLAHNFSQMLYLRPRNKFEEFDHCWLVGGGTHPGSGLPTIYESGRIVANLLARAHGMAFISKNLHA